MSAAEATDTIIVRVRAATKRWREHAFVQRLSRSKTLIAIVTVGAFLMGEGKHLDSFGTASLDALFRITAPLDPEHVVIVEVNEGDYDALFHRRRPLDPAAVRSIIGAVAAAKPVVIGVDLGTAYDDFRSLTPDAAWPPIVWAEEAIKKNNKDEFDPVPAVGGRRLSSRESAGIALLPLDSGGVLRRYRREFPTPGGPIKSFVTAVVEASGGPRSSGPRGDIVLRFSTLPYQFVPYASQFVLKAAEQPDWAGRFEGKVVLLGGHYFDARDAHLTPAGEQQGVEILAHAIESELRGATVRPAGRTRMAVLQISLGILVVFLYYRFGLRAATWASLAVIPLGSALCSYLAFGTLALWLYFVPVVLVFLIHQLYDRALSYLKTFEKMARGSVAAPPS